jgi:hypothetical protein
MNGIVLDLQADALDANVDIATLLRKAFWVAKKLKLSEFEKWVDSEINGYRGDLKVPLYREISGETKGWNSSNREWMPLLIPDNEWHKTLSNRLVSDSIASLVSLLESDGILAMPFPSEINVKISKMVRFPTQYALIVSRNSIYAIIETVRTKILNWAIMLEENGIIGDGLAFSDNEKEIANTATHITQYINNFYNSANNIQIQQGTKSSNQEKV